MEIKKKMGTRDRFKDMIPRGQCRKSCNGRNRAARRKRGGPVKKQMLKMTSFCDSSDSFFCKF